MNKQIMTRALMIIGLMCIGSIATFAQDTYTAKPQRVALDQVDSQPFAASVVAVSATQSLNLTPEQSTKISALNSQVASLHSERARLWKEYYALKARPDFNDAMAAAEAAPRMHRIVEINSQLSSIVSRQDRELASILTPAQRSSLSQMVRTAQAAQ